MSTVFVSSTLMCFRTSTFEWSQWTPWYDSDPPHMEHYECIFRSGDELTVPKNSNTAGHHYQRPVITVEWPSASLHLENRQYNLY